jgi:phytanoyl-CoA hydroxylase
VPLTKKQLTFKKDGYLIERNIFDFEEMEDLFMTFYSICLNCALRNKFKNNYQPISTVSFPENLKDLDFLVLDIVNEKKGLLGEVYDTFSYSMSFLRFIASKKTENLIREVLGTNQNDALYGFANRMRIDPPADERRTYGWHQEVFYNIPYSNFIQTWSPILRNTTTQNGTLEVKKGSHKEGIAKQSWNEVEGRVTQIIVDTKITDKYETTVLEMNLGDLLIFDSHLIHKSGHNSTKDETRFSLVGTWNDVACKDFRAPLPIFKNRSISYEEYFKKIQGLI